ncbi:MAG TPA: hypothetical protein VHK24_06510 [Steroidobacter sp.]|jgi:hypothetical protein|nr:hypothetical protein [Steroidobacter sp.]
MDDSQFEPPTDPTLRRYSLAQRLTWHQARTYTIQRFTALSRHQLALLRKRWAVPGDLRRRGPHPKSLYLLLRSPNFRLEAACAAVVCEMLGAVPGRAAALDRRKFYSLQVGERLCAAYEALRGYIPDARLEFEHLLLLVLALADGREFALGACIECGAAVLIDLLSVHNQRCTLCSRDKHGVRAAALSHTANLS